jgi:homoserine O-acetyltransferase
MNRNMAAGILAAAPAIAGTTRAQTPPAPTAHAADFVIRDFHFRSGEILPELKIHYRTLGSPLRDASGRITKAVLLLHGTGGDGSGFMRPRFGGELFGPGAGRR